MITSSILLHDEITTTDYDGLFCLMSCVEFLMKRRDRPVQIHAILKKCRFTYGIPEINASHT